MCVEGRRGWKAHWWLPRYQQHLPHFSSKQAFLLANQHHKLERAGQDWRSRVWTNQDRQGMLVAPTVDAASHIEARSPVLRG